MGKDRNEIFNRDKIQKKGYVFLSFARKFGDKYGKKIDGYFNKNWYICCKTASKRVVQKTAEAIKLLQPIKQRKQNKITFHQSKGSQ